MSNFSHNAKNRMATSIIKNPKSYTDTGFITGRVSPNNPQYNIKNLYHAANGHVTADKEDGGTDYLIYSAINDNANYEIRSLYWGADGHLHVITGNGTDHTV